MKTLISLGRGMLWAIAIGTVAYFFGLYNLATDMTGFGPLLALAAASIGIIALFWSESRVASLFNYEICIFALWHGHLCGSVSYSAFICGSWFFLAFFWPWMFFAVLGGLMLFSHKRDTTPPGKRTTRVAMIVTLVAGTLLASCFAHLLTSEKQPILIFNSWKTYHLQALTFSPDGKSLATLGGIGEEGKTVRLWDAATGKAKGYFTKDGANNGLEIAAMRFAGNPPLLAVSSSWSGYYSPKIIVVQIWNVATREAQHRFQWDDELSIRQPIFSRDGRLFAYANEKQNVRLFDLQKGKVDIKLARDGSSVRCLALTPACDVLACATFNGQLEIWNLADSRRQKTFDVENDVLCMAFSPDGLALACGMEGGSVEMFDLDGGSIDRKIECFDKGDVDSIAFSPDGATIACGGNNGVTKLVDVNQQKVIAAFRTWGGWRTVLLAFSSDGSRLATGDANGRVAIWEIALHGSP